MSEKNERPALELVTESAEFPRTFGNYLLLSALGQGGMGDVYLAKHGGIAGIEKHCVLKTLRPQFTDDREYVARFIDEARIVVQLSHKNICSVFDVGTVDGRYYLAMDYIAGRDLKTLMTQLTQTGHKLDRGLALHMACETLEALDYAHRHIDPSTGEPLRLVHRDVSPQNVMVSFEGEVKLIDFGLAVSSIKLERTAPNVVMGKVAYMSPEQVRGDPVDGRTDQFAVAVMLYELLADERFYDVKTPYEIWSLAGTGGYRPKRWETLDAKLQSVLSVALASNPDERYKTCAELREALDSYRSEVGLRGGTVGLREVVERVMGDEISSSRQQLSRFKNVKLLRVESSGPNSQPIMIGGPALPNKGPTEPTMTGIAQRPESTEAMRKEMAAIVAPASRKVALVAAALGGAGVVALLAIFATHAREPAEPTPPPTPVVGTPVMAPPTPAPVVPPVAPIAEHPVDAPIATPVEKPIEKAVDAPIATPVEKPIEKAVEKPAEKPTDKPDRHTRTTRTNSSTTTTTTTTPPKAPASAGSEIDGFKQRCPAKACTQALSRMHPDLGANFGDLVFMQAWNRSLRECRTSCP